MIMKSFSINRQIYEVPIKNEQQNDTDKQTDNKTMTRCTEFSAIGPFVVSRGTANLLDGTAPALFWHSVVERNFWVDFAKSTLSSFVPFIRKKGKQLSLGENRTHVLADKTLKRLSAQY